MKIAIIGATGVVGKELLSLLEEREFPVTSLSLFASEKSRNTPISFRGEILYTQTIDSLDPFDLLFFCAGSAVSKQWRGKTNGIAIDLSSAFRLDPDVPLVIPEINPLQTPSSWIASPNCAATILLLPLAPLHRAWNATRIVLSTYQAASGGGYALTQKLLDETTAVCRQQPLSSPLPYAFNLYPHNSPLLQSGYVEEEEKIAKESQKILSAPHLAISATCVRVPVLRAHSLSANISFEQPFTLEEATELLQNAPGVSFFEDRPHNRFATPYDASGKDPILCGRLRKDLTHPNTLELWAVGDQLRKGAALNAVQIGEQIMGIKRPCLCR